MDRYPFAPGLIFLRDTEQKELGLMPFQAAMEPVLADTVVVTDAVSAAKVVDPVITAGYRVFID